MSNVLRHLHLSRRTFLRGVGATLALPWLDAMEPALAYTSRLRPAAGAARTVFIFSPNGMHMPDWTPDKTGAEFALPHILEPFTPVRAHLTVLSGLALDGALAHGDGPGDHARAAAAFLTGMHPRKTGGADLRAGTSVDQVIATKLGGETRFPSLQLGFEPGSAAGICDSGYSCAYSNNISWASPTTPLTKETNPRELFARLFGDSDRGAPPHVVARQKRARASILDAVRSDARQLRGNLGAGDQAKLDDYLISVRELEVRLARPEGGGPADAAGMKPPEETPADLPTYIRLMYDLIAVAFRADLTRTVSLMIGNAGSGRSYPFIDVPEAHHHLSHHGRDADKQVKIRKINRFHMEQLAYFAGQLGATKDGDKSLLDRTAVLVGSGISDGDRHNHDDLPVIVLGRLNGTLAGNQHLRLPAKTPLANLHLSLLDRLNVRVTGFGDATDRIAGL